MEVVLDYVLKNFETIFGIKSGEFKISYGIDNKSGIQIRRSDNGYFTRKEPLNLAKIVWKEWNKVKIPFLFFEKNTDNLMSIDSDQVIINYDIIASSFYFLSNWQEYVCQEKDEYGRFMFTDSIQHKLSIVDKPVVNYYFDILRYAIKIRYKVELNQNLWRGKNLSVCITHDIDLCESAWLQGSYRELRGGHIFSPFRLIARKIFSNDEWFNFGEIIKIENKYKVNSTFFFLANNRAKGGIINADYNIAKSKFSKVFNLIEKNGSEVAVHGSAGTHLDSESFRSEIKKIGRKIYGNRFHYLLYNTIYSPGILSDAGIKYDSTLGFAETPGFRNSFCFPFYIFDIKNFRSTDVLEIPLNVMDISFEKRYMGLEKEEALQTMLNILEETERFNGCMTLLWHNTCFSEYKYKGWKDIYIRFLEKAVQKDALITSGKNISERFCLKLE